MNMNDIKEYIFPTIGVTYREDNPYAKTFVAMIGIESSTEREWQTIFISAISKEAAVDAIGRMPNIAVLKKIQPLHEALEVLEGAAVKGEVLM